MNKNRLEKLKEKMKAVVRQSTKPPIPPTAEEMRKARELEKMRYAYIGRLIPKSLPAFIRDDVRQIVCEGILKGEIRPGTFPRAVQLAISEANHRRESKRYLSLDALPDFAAIIPDTVPHF